MELTETLLMLLVGGLLVPGLQMVKKLFKWNGKTMLWASVVVSFGCSIIISIFTKDGGIVALLANPSLFLTGGGSVFATATIIYRLVKEKIPMNPVDAITGGS
ncbi:hypothetical protein KKA53_05075 [Candidatus Dependentiae bacterium]|nr:hypothetical protein [Candidatus Dependentiae bacterium]